MRRLIVKLSIFLCCVLLAVIICCMGMHRYMVATPLQRLTYFHDMNYSLSIEKMKRKTAPSIIILGGSGCGFGFLSPVLSDYYQMPVINTGTCATFGLRLIMNAAMPYISEGDLVLLIPEYNHFCGTYFWGNQDALNAIFTAPEVYEDLSLYHKLHLLQYYPRRFERVIRSKNNAPHQDVNDTTNATPYSRCSLNEYGDATCYHKRSHQCDIPIVDMLTGVDNLVAMYQTQLFIHYVEAMGATCIFLPPAYRDVQYDHDADQIQRTASWLSRMGIPYQSAPERYRLPDSLFYDAHYHLTKEGCALRTQMVIEDMDRILNR